MSVKKYLFPGLAFLMGTSAMAQAQALSAASEKLRADVLSAFDLSAPADVAMIHAAGAPSVVETATGIEVTLTDVSFGPADKSFSLGLGTLKVAASPSGDGLAAITITGLGEIAVKDDKGKPVGKLTLTDPVARSTWSEKVGATVGFRLGFAKATGDFMVPADATPVDPKVKPAKPPKPAKPETVRMEAGASEVGLELTAIDERLWSGSANGKLGALSFQDESNTKVVEVGGGSLIVHYDGLDIASYRRAMESIRGPLADVSRSTGKAGAKPGAAPADPNALLPLLAPFFHDFIPAMGHETATARLDKLVVTPPPGAKDESGRVAIDRVTETIDLSAQGAGSTALTMAFGFSFAGLSIEKMPFVKLGSAGFDLKINKLDPVAILDQFTKTPGGDPNAAPAAPLAGIEISLGAEDTAVPIDATFLPMKKLGLRVGLADIDQPSGSASLTVDEARDPAPVTAPPATAAKIAGVPDTATLSLELTSIPGIPALMSLAQGAAMQDPNALIELLKSNGSEAEISATEISWSDSSITITGKGAAGDQSKFGGSGDVEIRVCGFDKLVDRVAGATGSDPKQTPQMKIFLKGLAKTEPGGCKTPGDSTIYLVSLDEAGAIKVNDQDMSALMAPPAPPPGNAAPAPKAAKPAPTPKPAN